MVPERDGLIIRHKETGAVARAAEIASVKVTNAGDGTGEHPTQAILDTKTIRQHFPHLDERHVTFFGDINRGRTIHSTAPLLATMGVQRMTFVAPHEELRAQPDMTEDLRASGVEVTETDDLREVVNETDIIYAVRTQYKHMTDEEHWRSLLTGKCFITEEMMRHSKARLMHPGPEDGKDLNIQPELHSGPQSLIKEQVSWGEWTRMALLGLQAGKSIGEAIQQTNRWFQERC